jgi:2-haloacid dehalogenase
MNRPSAVVFDLGKVLLDFDYGITVRRIQQHCRVSLGELEALIGQTPLLYRYESNQLSTAQFFAEVQAASGYCGSLNEFRGLFADIFTEITPMVQLQRELRGRGIPRYIFSNTNELAIEQIQKQFPFFNEFDGYVLSYEHNALKPDHRLYEVVEKCTGRRSADLLYIDDRPENVATGQERGWQTILHESPAATRALVARTGLLGGED